MFRRQAKDGNGSSGSESGKIDNLVHIEERSEGSTDQEADQVRALLNAKIANPLAGFTHDELSAKGEAYVRAHGLGGEGSEEVIRAFRLGAILAQDPKRTAREVDGLTEDEIAVLEKELTNKWSQPGLLYLIIVLCSTCAAVQGMDETVVNGAQIFYSKQFGIAGNSSRDTWLLGLTNSAPYLCCALLGCWLTIPLNAWFGRRGTIFLTCVISAVACIWQGLTDTWWHMFIARFVLGAGIGAKSATVPMYAAECSPPQIRGALVMQWQVWTAFGIMLGYIADLAFYGVRDVSGIVGLNWRLMMGSAALPAIVVFTFVFLCPESPRWYMSRGNHVKAFDSMSKLRYNKVQAARDIFYMHTLLEAEKGTTVLGKSKVKEMFTVHRNRRAMQASQILMFMQQFCGVNIIAYYSSEIFVNSGFSLKAALIASLGFGIINFLFALPAVFTIDNFGRRNLLLFTFPLMSLCLFFTGFSFWIPTGSDSKAQIACVALGIYLFGIVYSPGAGPVPFTYSAEAYPLYIRAEGMALATATTWFFNFVLAVTWPSLLKVFKPQGAFAWYGVWNIIGFLGVLFFVPETKGKTLEELDQVFGVRTRDQVAFGGRQIVYFFKRYVLRRDIQPEKLFDDDVVQYTPDTFSGEKTVDPTARA